MNDIAARLHDAADMAERTAVAQQHAQLSEPLADPTVIAALDLAADALRYAAVPLDPSPVVPRRFTIQAVVMVGVQVLTSVAVLAAAPDPSQPLVLAVTLGGSGLVAKVVRDTVAAIWDRHEVRGVVAVGGSPVAIQQAIVELRSCIAEIIASLTIDDVGMRVGRRIESALVWVDDAERAAAQPSGPV